MSKNSKNARLVAEARKRKRTEGFKGPANTSPKHEKKNAFWQVGNKTYSQLFNVRKATVAQ